MTAAVRVSRWSTAGAVLGVVMGNTAEDSRSIPSMTIDNRCFLPLCPRRRAALGQAAWSREVMPIYSGDAPELDGFLHVTRFLATGYFRPAKNGRSSNLLTFLKADIPEIRRFLRPVA